MLGFSVMLFSYGLIAASAAILLASGVEMVDFSLKLMAWGGSSIVVGILASGLGKLLCAGAPEEGARTLIVASLVCDFVVIGLRFAIVSGQVPVLVGGICIWLLALVSYFTFLRFLTRMGDNVGEPRVGQYVAIIYAGIGGGFVIPLLIMVSWPVFILALCGVSVITTLVYNYTIFTLFRALPLYIEEVKMGITDPTESGEERKEKERKERLHGPAGGGGPSQAKPPEEPQGEPPEGAKLYRIPKGLEPLHMAVKEGDRYKVELRLSQGDDPRKPIRHNLTPLHIAASVGVMEVADALIKAGAPVDETCEMGLTPLYFAIQTGNHNVVGFLLNKGANLFHQNDHGYTPLHWACCAPHPNFIGPARVKMLSLLISQGADLNATTKDGKTARDLCLENQLEESIGTIDRYLGTAAPAQPRKSIQDEQVGSEETVEPSAFPPFLGTELSVIPSNLQPLHEAVKDGDPEKVQVQLAAGANIRDTLAGGIAPIHITAITGVMSVSEMLMRYGATVNDTYEHNLTPIFLAVHLNNLAMVGYLISRGGDVNHQDAMGRTPLHWGAAAPHEKLGGGNRVKMVQFLLENGADPTIKDQNGQTAEDLARAAEYDDVVTIFVDSAPSPESESSTDDDDEGYYA